MAPITTRWTLLVDDNAAVRKMLALFLTDLEFKIDEFADPYNALVAFTEAPDKYDLIVADVFMGGMTGFELVDRIRAIQPGKPAILISGVPYRKDGELIENRLMFLSKPFTKEKLASTIEAVLGTADRSCDVDSDHA